MEQGNDRKPLSKLETSLVLSRLRLDGTGGNIAFHLAILLYGSSCVLKTQNHPLDSTDECF